MIALLACGICVGLGLWQFGRFEGKRDRAAVIEANYAAEPAALEDVLPHPHDVLRPEQDWTVVTLHGSYCTEPACDLYVRNRPLSTVVGFWQLVPFTDDAGRMILVVRGWVDMDQQRSIPAMKPPLPQGPTTVTVRLRPAEGVLRGRSNPEGQVQTVSPPEVAEILGLDESQLVTGAYGVMATEDPGPAPPQPLEKPDTSLGPHLSYAFQWWIFAAFFPLGFALLTRRRIREDAEEHAAAVPGGACRGSAVSAQDAETANDSTPTQGDASAASGESEPTQQSATPQRPGPRRPHSTRPASTRRRRRTQDEEEEDALIDQQLG